MKEIAEFVKARIAEDIAAARSATAGPWTTSGPDSIAQWVIFDGEWSVAEATAYDHDRPLSNRPGARGPGYIDPDANAAHIARWNPARVLAELSAKRDIVDGCVRAVSYETNEFNRHMLGERLRLAVLAPMSAPYSDHPDYRQEWNR
jgi:hypothetical protein